MRTMGIDFGLARIGIALSDETKFLANPYETYKRKNTSADIDYFIDLIKSNNVDEIVCGLPLNMQGEEQEIAHQTREFMEQIASKSGVPIHYLDERLSSQMAEDILKERERDWRKRKEKLDAVSATLILQDYLDTRSRY